MPQNPIPKTVAQIDLYKIFDLLDNCIFWKDCDGCYLGGNKPFYEALGLSNRAQIIGKTDYDLFIREEAEQLIINDKNTLRDGKLITEECITVNGKTDYYATTKTALLNEAGEVIGILGNSFRITNIKNQMELEKQSAILEEQVKTEQIIDAIDASIYWKDINGYIRGCNKYVLNMFKALGRDDIIGKNDYDLFCETDAAKIAANDKFVIENGCSFTGEESGIVNGIRRVYLTTKSPLRDSQMNIVGVLGMSINITSKKELEQLEQENQAKIYQARIEEQAQFKRIVDQVVHDIRSPIASMQMILPLCNKLPENLRVSLNKSATRMLDIANNLLNKFKTQEEAVINVTNETSIDSTLISAELLEIITEKKYEYTKLPVDINVRISRIGYFVFLNIDMRAFKRMISNLINNAVDAFEGGVGEIITQLDVIDNNVQIIVQDNGKGIPEEIKTKILNNVMVTSGKTKGHGIGFSQIRETLISNNGKLNIESEVGVGTKIILTFPKIKAPDWIAQTIELYNNDLIIILDDDDSIHGAWEARFKQAAPKIARKHFKLGNEAVSFINNLGATEKSQVFLLTDYELLRQDLHGLDVVNQTKIERSILVTSHHNNQSIRDLAKLTGTKILPKPLASEIAINILPT